MDLYHVFSYNTPGVKTGSTWGVTSWNNRNKEGRINFVAKMTKVSDPGPSWPSCYFTCRIKIIKQPAYLDDSDKGIFL